MTDVFTLYGASISLYTGKARAYLRYRNVPFAEQGITAEIIKKIGYFMVPVLETPDGELVQDTTEIIDYLEERFKGPSVYPEDPAEKLASLLIEVYGDEWLVIPAMHYRWKYNRDYILLEFGRSAAPDASPEEQTAIGAKISAGFSGSLPLLGITEKTEPAIEAWYEGMLKQLNTHLADREYLFGSRPSIGDYGLMGPLYAHNYRDPWSGNLMRRIAPNVARWVDMMNTPQPNSGKFESELGDSLQPVLTQMFAECIPAIVSTCEKLGDWIDDNPGKAIPRSIGTQKVKIGGVAAERNIFPFNQWMFQRPLRYYQSLTGVAKQSADHLLRIVGGYDLMQLQLQHTLARKNYQLRAAM